LFKQILLILEDKGMPNLAQLTQEIRDRYASLPSYIVPAEKIGLTESGYLTTGKNEFPLTIEGLDQFAQRADIPPHFFRTLESDHRSIIFNRRFQAKVADGSVSRDIRVNLNKNNQIIGFDDPHLLRINPIKLLEVIGSSLPKGLSTEQIEVACSDFSPSRFHVSCFSPQIIGEPLRRLWYPDFVLPAQIGVPEWCCGSRVQREQTDKSSPAAQRSF
jgi:hypothetical protein